MFSKIREAIMYFDANRISFQYQLKVAAFQVQCDVRAATWMLYMASFEIETASFHKSLPKEYFRIYWPNRITNEGLL